MFCQVFAVYAEGFVNKEVSAGRFGLRGGRRYTSIMNFTKRDGFSGFHLHVLYILRLLTLLHRKERRVDRFLTRMWLSRRFPWAAPLGF